MTDAEKENQSIKIRIDLDNVKDPLDMTPEERKEYWAEWQVARKQIDEKLMQLMNTYRTTILEGQLSLFQEEEEPPRPSDQSEPAAPKKKGRTKKEAITATRDARKNAFEIGALMSINGHATSFSSDDLKNALNAFSIKRLPDLKDRAPVFDDTGKLNVISLGQEKLAKISSLDEAFLMGILSAVILTPDDNSNSLILYLPGFMGELSIDPRGFSNALERKRDSTMQELRLQKFMEKLLPYEEFVGETIDGSFYRVAAFQSYDSASETVTITTPYLFAVRRIAEAAAEKEKGKPTLNKLFHGDIATEQNWAAVELANRILSGVERRGKYTSPPWRCQFTTLVSDCPQLSSELYAIEKHSDYVLDENGLPIKDKKTGKDKKYNRSQAYNSKLKQVFEAAYRIILEKSDAPLKYRNFKIPYTVRKTAAGTEIRAYDIPTKSTMRRNLVITHDGIIDNWKAL